MAEYVIDAKDMAEKELNRTIKEQAPNHDKLIINNPESRHNICAGLIEDVDIEINGSAGYFVGTMVDGPNIHINGNAGWFAGDNMTEGELIIEGTAGDGAGQGIYGGTVVVKGNTGSRTGEIMKGGTVIIGGNSGYMTGLLMMGGKLIILGDVTDDVGESIMRGTIYVLGSVKSLGKNAIMKEITVEDQEDLKETLTKYGFELSDADYANFKKIVCEIMAASKIQHYTDSPIDVKLGLFCMENFSYKYFGNLLKEYDLTMNDIEKFRIEKGFVFLFLKTKETVKIPLSVAKRIIRKNCNICVELTSETSDISIGSIGSDDGWSTIIIRTEKGEEIVNGAIEQKFIESKELTEPQFELLNRIAESKINKNLEVIEKREFFARPVLYQREKSDDLINKEISGACVLCGACEYACPDNLITIDDTKPRMKGDCPEDCHACFAVCPRTFIPENLRNDNSKALGDFIKVLSVKSVRHTQGQDGSIVTTILDYLLTNDIVTDALIVDKEDLLAWKPYAKITNDIDEVIKSGGTKYSVCPVFKPLRDIKEEGK